jgi:trehalose utilization protein
MLRFVFTAVLLLCSRACTLAVEKVHVLVWDERQPRQAKRLGESEDLELRSVWLEDPSQGLEAGNLEWADVIIWWGHVRHSDVTQDNAQRVLDYVRNGKLDLIALHSAHWARPFVKAMNWRSVEDAKQHLKKMSHGKKLTIETVAPPRERTVPIHGSTQTPAVFGYKKNASEYHGVIHLPYCCFPDYRPDAKPSTVRIRKVGHPITKGLPASFQVPQTEMYNEPFHVPDPDEVVFEETWERGERFRAGMVWNIGDGKVFYFRPGHETYPVYKQPQVIQVLENASRWLGAE